MQQALESPDRTSPLAASLDKDPDHPIKTLYCSHCGYQHKVQLSCGSRVCPKCRRKWFGYHFNSLYRLVQTWPVTNSLTLTLQNILDNEFGRHDVQRIRQYFSTLRRRFKNEFYGGFYVVQATNIGNGWHLHLHVIFDGKFIKKDRLVAAWRDITGGSYIVDVKRVKDAQKAIRYLLADFSGKPRIRPQDCATYDAIFKGSRLVQPFGAYRSVKLKVPFRCPACGNTDWVTFEWIEERARCEWGDDP